jgi:hypothetical protein
MAQAADAVDEDERLPWRRSHGLDELAERVRHAGRGFIVREQHGAVRLTVGQALPQRGGISGLAPRDLHALDLRAERLGDRREPIAKGADRHGQHPVTG